MDNKYLYQEVQSSNDLSCHLTYLTLLLFLVKGYKATPFLVTFFHNLFPNKKILNDKGK